MHRMVGTLLVTMYVPHMCMSRVWLIYINRPAMLRGGGFRCCLLCLYLDRIRCFAYCFMLENVKGSSGKNCLRPATLVAVILRAGSFLCECQNISKCFVTDERARSPLPSVANFEQTRASIIRRGLQATCIRGTTTTNN